MVMLAEKIRIHKAFSATDLGNEFADRADLAPEQSVSNRFSRIAAWCDRWNPTQVVNRKKRKGRSIKMKGFRRHFQSRQNRSP